MSKAQQATDEGRHKFKPATLTARASAWDTIDEDFLEDIEHLALPHSRFPDRMDYRRR